MLSPQKSSLEYGFCLQLSTSYILKSFQYFINVPELYQSPITLLLSIVSLSLQLYTCMVVTILSPEEALYRGYFKGRYTFISYTCSPFLFYFTLFYCARSSLILISGTDLCVLLKKKKISIFRELTEFLFTIQKEGAATKGNYWPVL